MKRFSRLLAVLTAVAIVLTMVVPLALAAKATPSLSLKAKPASIKVGETVTFSGTVQHAVAKHTTVELWLVKAKKSTLKASGMISSTGAFEFTAKGARAGTCTLSVTYKAGKATYKSNEVEVTVTK